MAVFEKVAPKTPAKAGRITIHITTTLNQDGTTSVPAGSYELQLLDAANKEVDNKSGDLAPVLTSAQQQGVVDLMTALRVKANAEAV